MEANKTSKGYKWEGLACVICFALCVAFLKLNPSSPLAIIGAILLALFGSAFGLSYMRTWKSVYRFCALTVLAIASAAYYLLILLPIK